MQQTRLSNRFNPRALFVLAALSLLMAATGVTASELIEKQISERIAPVGDVCIEGDPCAASAVVANTEPRSGEEIYNKLCTTCHATGLTEAPIFGDLAQWQPRIDAGMEALYSNSINGLNLMPAKGLCMDCSDDEIKATVDYMVEATK